MLNPVLNGLEMVDQTGRVVGKCAHPGDCSWVIFEYEDLVLRFRVGSDGESLSAVNPFDFWYTWITLDPQDGSTTLEHPLRIEGMAFGDPVYLEEECVGQLYGAFDFFPDFQPTPQAMSRLVVDAAVGEIPPRSKEIDDPRSVELPKAIFLPDENNPVVVGSEAVLHELDGNTCREKEYVGPLPEKVRFVLYQIIPVVNLDDEFVFPLEARPAQSPQPGDPGWTPPGRRN